MRTVPRGSLRVTVDGFLGGFGFDQHRLAVHVVGLADVGDREVARGPLDQPHAQALLQQRDAPAQFGLGHAQRASGRREAAVLDHLGEVVQVVEVLHRPCPPVFTR
jgi:hypothetical protein